MKARLASMRSDDGFTIVEVIIAMMVMGVIMAPLASAFFISIGTTKSATQNVTNSDDAQLLSAFFVDDVSSADSVSQHTTCGGAHTVVQFRWTDGAIERRVAYAWTEDAATENNLHVSPVYQLS